MLFLMPGPVNLCRPWTSVDGRIVALPGLICIIDLACSCLAGRISDTVIEAVNSEILLPEGWMSFLTARGRLRSE